MAVSTDRPNASRHSRAPWVGVGSVLPVMVAVVAALSGCAGGDVPEVSTDDSVLVLGREVYSRNCIACHGADGRGGTGTKLNEGSVVAAFPDPAEQFAIIAQGKDQMPAFTGKLSDDEIEAVVRFTREGL